MLIYSICEKEHYICNSDKLTNPINIDMKKLMRFAGLCAIVLGLALSCAPDDVTTETLSTPTGLTTGALTSTTAELSWTAVAGTEKYSILINDEISYTTASTVYEVDGLVPETEYRWKVQAMKGNTGSEWSPTTNFKTLKVGQAAVATPIDLYVTDITATTVKLTWAHADADIHEVSINNEAAVSVSEPSYDADNLTPATTYTWRVSGKDGQWSKWVEGDEFTTGYSVTPAPANLVATDITRNSARLTWQHPDADSHEVVVDNGAAVSVTGLSYQATGFAAGSSHTWKVRSCKDSVWSSWVQGASFTTGTGEPDVYVAGYTYDALNNYRAVLWKNGIAENLSNTKSLAAKVCVVGSDVYVSGEIHEANGKRQAVIWKNGVAEKLSTDHSWAESVFVAGNNVYAAGTIRDNNNVYHATLWNNGVAQTMSSDNARGYDVFVLGSDVYVAGTVNNKATIWKNGVGTDISFNSNSMPLSIFVSANGTPHVAGYATWSGDQKATYWTINARGIWTRLKLNDSAYISMSVLEHGSNVYVAGSMFDSSGNDRAVLWTNNVPKFLSLNQSSARSVYYSAGNAYVAGLYTDDEGAENGVVWKNNSILTVLPPIDGRIMEIMSIFVN